MFLAAFGFFTAVVFLPRWFQVVGGTSATISGYEMLPLLGGVIITAVASRARSWPGPAATAWLIFAALVTLASGLAMLTQLRADTPLPILWAWMFVTGLGMGPVFSVFALVVQNSVPVTQIGAATSSLSFFQQVGGSVGLAITGHALRELDGARAARRRLGPPGSRRRSGGRSRRRGGARSRASATPGQRCSRRCRRSARGLVEPFLPAIVDAVHSAFSIATASTFSIGIGATVVAAALVLSFRDAPAAARETAWDGGEIGDPAPEATAA